MFHHIIQTIFLLLVIIQIVESYVPSELCTKEDTVRKRCIKWVSTPIDDVLYNYVQTSKAATCAIHKTTSKYFLCFFFSLYHRPYKKRNIYIYIFFLTITHTHLLTQFFKYIIP